MTTQKVGPLIKTIEFQPETTLSDLLDQLYEENQEGWRRIYDTKKKKMRPPINLILNGKPLSSSVVANLSFWGRVT